MVLSWPEKNWFKFQLSHLDDVQERSSWHPVPLLRCIESLFVDGSKEHNRIFPRIVFSDNGIGVLGWGWKDTPKTLAMFSDDRLLKPRLMLIQVHSEEVKNGARLCSPNREKAWHSCPSYGKCNHDGVIGLD